MDFASTLLIMNLSDVRREDMHKEGCIKGRQSIKICQYCRRHIYVSYITLAFFGQGEGEVEFRTKSYQSFFAAGPLSSLGKLIKLLTSSMS